MLQARSVGRSDGINASVFARLVGYGQGGWMPARCRMECLHGE